MIYCIVNLHEGGSLTTMYQHAVTVRNGLAQSFASIIVDSVVAFSAHSVVNKRSAFYLLI